MAKSILDVNQIFHNQQDRWLDPKKYLDEDYKAVYENNELEIGWPKNSKKIYKELSRKASACIIGIQEGDEGKGAMIDREIEKLLNQEGIKKVYVIRFQGGSNAGHTVYDKNGNKVPLHQVPSSIMYSETIGIMDSGMIIHPEDLRTEIQDAEEILNRSLKDKLVLSQDAMLCTDLERAKEVLNRNLSEGKSSGGTGRGISTTVADKYARLGFSISDLMKDEWETKLTNKYEIYKREFESHGFNLEEMDVPDFDATRKAKKTNSNSGAVTRKVGDLKTFLERLRLTREWLKERNLVKNTFLLHKEASLDSSIGILIEGSQATGLDAHVGRHPDVTSTNTTAYGITEGTRFYKPENIENRIGVFKITYMSSVGDENSRMITDSKLKREEYAEDEKSTLDEDQLQAEWIRKAAHEKGTTTGRYRDICYLDLELMRYNCRMGGIEVLAGTHLDIAREDAKVKVCAYYTNDDGEVMPYQPGVIYQKPLTPHYIHLDGWNGGDAKKARNFEELPVNAQKFLAFVQRNIGFPITAVTNGPERQDMIIME